MSLSHSQRDLVAQDVGLMHQVSYSSSVSTFCQNEIKDRNYKSVIQHIFISFYLLAEALFLMFADGRKETSAMGRKWLC